MRRWYPWVLVAAAFAFSAVVFNRLPATMPTHWDVHGEANGWSGRAFAAWISPGLMIVIALVLPNLPKIDPRRANYEKFRGSYDLVVNAAITMLGILHVAMLGSALGWPISMTRIAVVVTGGLFIVLGNVMPRARPNWWFGIRTPWTLSNDRVWERTHRVSGYLFVGAGVLLALTSVLPSIAMLPIVIGCCVAVSVISLVYSYVAWRQETAR